MLRFLKTISETENIDVVVDNCSLGRVDIIASAKNVASAYVET